MSDPKSEKKIWNSYRFWRRLGHIESEESIRPFDAYKAGYEQGEYAAKDQRIRTALDAERAAAEARTNTGA